MNIRNELQLYIVPTATEKYFQPFFEGCYSLWESVWLKTLQELDGLTTLTSDGFTRQDFFAVITYHHRPVALCCFKMMNISLRSHRLDSWFAPWPQQLLEDMAQKFPRALIPSWLTVHPDFRKSKGFSTYNLSLLLAELISLNCLEQRVDIAFGTPRKDLSVNKLVAQAGAIPLEEDILHHGVPIDLVAFFPERLRRQTFSVEVQTLWQHRFDLRKEHKPLKTKDPIYENSLH